MPEIDEAEIIPSEPEAINIAVGIVRFISILYSDIPHGLPSNMFRPMTAAWTTRSPEEECEALACGFDTVIFENYLPASATVTEAERKAAENAVREKKTACEK